MLLCAVMCAAGCSRMFANTKWIQNNFLLINVSKLCCVQMRIQLQLQPSHLDEGRACVSRWVYTSPLSPAQQSNWAYRFVECETWHENVYTQDIDSELILQVITLPNAKPTNEPVVIRTNISNWISMYILYSKSVFQFIVSPTWLISYKITIQRKKNWELTHERRAPFRRRYSGAHEYATRTGACGMSFGSFDAWNGWHVSHNTLGSGDCNKITENGNK